MDPAITQAVDVHWKTCQRSFECDECRNLVVVGERVAAYDDVSHEGLLGKLFHRTRHYCAGCGELLEDSLTTEDLA
jgi:hypothetical protein